ncbi:hypothetical protein AAFP35_05435 [Gordonia sp. CPCC 206044]|uniref:hypothetical protein n=1 Tax=Gordonia sp. CPCC 206044 TaxID=3140793 RepID=UPI003AF3F988
MKHIHRVLLAIAAFTAVALVLPSAQAQAAPARSSQAPSAPAPFVTAPFVTAAIAADGHSVVAKLRDAAFVPNAAGTELQVRDRAGRVVDSLPLVGTMDGFRVPLRWSVGADRSSATLTPIVSRDHRALLDAAATDAAKRNKAKPRAKRLTKNQRYDLMWKELNKGWKGNTPISTLVGGLIGFIVFGWIGAGVGAAIGAYLGYQTSNPQAWPSVLAWWNTP